MGLATPPVTRKHRSPSKPFPTSQPVEWTDCTSWIAYRFVIVWYRLPQLFEGFAIYTVERATVKHSTASSRFRLSSCLSKSWIPSTQMPRECTTFGWPTILFLCTRRSLILESLSTYMVKEVLPQPQSVSVQGSTSGIGPSGVIAFGFMSP